MQLTLMKPEGGIKRNTPGFLFRPHITCWRVVQILQTSCQVAKHWSEQTTSWRCDGCAAMGTKLFLHHSAHAILTVNQSWALPPGVKLTIYFHLQDFPVPLYYQKCSFTYPQYFKSYLLNLQLFTNTGESLAKRSSWVSRAASPHLY